MRAMKRFFPRIARYLNNKTSGFQVLNYLTSHDDGSPFDKERNKPYETATKLLLSAGSAQIYYGDESARGLIIEGTQGDATLRSFMNWEDIKTESGDPGYSKSLAKTWHFQKRSSFYWCRST